MLTLALIPGSTQPLYAQIVDQVACAIRSGQIAANDVLPSVRSVAERLAINPNTVAKAYAQLESTGLIRGLPGRGFLVDVSRSVLHASEQQRRMDEALTPMVSAAARYGWSRRNLITAINRRFDQEGLP